MGAKTARQSGIARKHKKLTLGIDAPNIQVISRFDTDIDSNDTWTSDANGLRLETRQRNHRAALWREGPTYFQCTGMKLSDNLQTCYCHRYRVSWEMNPASNITIKILSYCTPLPSPPFRPHYFWPACLFSWRHLPIQYCLA